MATLYVLLAGVSGWILSRRIEIIQRPLVAPVISTVLLVWPVQVLGVLQIFGWRGRIQFGTLVCVESALFTVACLACSTLPLSPESWPTSGTRLPAYLKLGGALLVGTYVLFASDLLTSFPGGWDALSYHLPVSLHLLQEGTLSIPISKIWQMSLPANAEIAMAVLLGTGYQSLAPLINLVAVLVATYATYTIGMEIAGNRTAALAAALIALSIPMVQFQTFAGLIDLFGAAFLLAAVALFLSGHSTSNLNTATARSRLSVCALSGLACGISVGSKPIYYVFGGVFYLLAVIALVQDSMRRCQRFGKTVLLIIVFTAGIAMPSVFWFVRGMKATKNPFYPLQIALWNHVVFEGYRSEQITQRTNNAPDDESNYVRARYEWLIYPWTEWKRGRSWDQMVYGTNTGYGAVFATFVPLGMAFFVKKMLSRKSGKTQTILFGVFCFLLATWWFALRREPRYGLPLWIFACSLSTPFLELLDHSASRPFRILFVCSLASTCLITSSRPALNILGRARAHQSSRASVYEYPAIIDQLPAGSRVVNYSQSYINNFALAGTDLGNRVIPFYALPAPPGGKLEVDPPFRGRSLSEDVLRDYRADYVIEELDDWKASPPPPASGLCLDSDTILSLGDENKRNRWRIWRVLKKPWGSRSSESTC